MSSADGSPISVPLDLETAGAQINSQAAAIADELASLNQQLQPLEGTWTGQAAAYYEGLQSEWNMAAAGLFGQDGVLGIIATAMGVTWANYSDAEATNVRTWQH